MRLIILIVCLVLIVVGIILYRNAVSTAKSPLAASNSGSTQAYNHLLVPIRVSGVDIGVNENKAVNRAGDIEVLIDGKYVRYGSYTCYSDSLRIGMITSRWVGGSDENGASSNAIQGRTYVRIHNMTEQPVILNDNIHIAPMATLQYRGREGGGVSLGTTLVDPRGIFTTFKLVSPATDIYYGVVSSVEQDSFSGWQLGTEFRDVADDPVHHVLERGFVGGPAKGAINYEALPSDAVGADRWGRGA